MSTEQQQIPNALDTLRLSRRQIQAVIQFLRRQQTGLHGSETRCEARLPFASEASIPIELRHPGGTVGRYLIRPHNLSSRGLGFLNGNFVYPGTACITLLPKLGDAGARGIAGRAVRCRHVAGNVHEIGVRFNEAIDLAEFIEDPATVAEAQRAGAASGGPRFRGAALVIEDSVDGRELLNFMFSRIGVNAVFIDKPRRAVDLIARRPFDIIFINADLRGTPGGELIHKIRRAGYTGPIAALTADDDRDAPGRLTSRGASHVLLKPFESDDLSALAEMHLKPEGGVAAGGGSPGSAAHQPLLSEHWDDARMRPLIISFLDRLDARLPRFRAAFDAGRTDAIAAACRELKGTAAGYGYPALGEAAEGLRRALRAGPGESRPALDEFLRLAEAACLARRSGRAQSA